MKILMLGRDGLFDATGGDRIQVEQTAHELRKLNIEVETMSALNPDFSKFDLVHVFQLDWNPDCYFQIQNAKKANKKIVLSAIHHNINELKRFDDLYQFDFRRITGTLIQDQFKRDQFKELYKDILKPKRLGMAFASWLIGFKKMFSAALGASDIVLVQTELEAQDLKTTYNVDFTWKVVTNGVSEKFFTLSETVVNPLPFENYILVVGRIEPRKNQESIIRAVASLRQETGLDLKLVLIGAKSGKKHFEYNHIIDNQIRDNPWITHLDHVDYNLMPAYYKFAKVCVSASWFETTGLTSLEALFCGTNAVASGARAKEYLGSYASYCDPHDVATVKNSIIKEYNSPRPLLEQSFKNRYTWRKTAEDTLAVYKLLLNK